MKKIILSFFACLALVFGSIIAWCFYEDILAAVLFFCALIPSCLFEEGMKELKTKK